MSADPRSRKPLSKVRRPSTRRSGVANDRGAPTLIAVVLVAVTNAHSLRRHLGSDGWGAAFLSFTAHAKITAGGGRLVQFAWDTVGLVFDNVTIDEFIDGFEAFTVLGQNVVSVIDGAPAFEFIAGAALGSDEIEALEGAALTLADAKLRGHSMRSTIGPAPLRLETVDLASDLALAVPRNEFFMVYQPKVHVRQRMVSSAEALIRWQHPILGLVMPDSFIDLADGNGDMRPITLWTLQHVIADQKKLETEGHALRIFINISGGLLTDRLFIEAACALIEDSGASIGFEITETAVIRDPDLAIANLERCAAIGIMLAIDDYGSGLSSLSYLKRLPATELKIDKSFITHLTSSNRDPLIVRSTIDLAHALEMEVTAEGVETPAALALLTVMGCEMVQGYLISPPLALPEFKTYLDDYRFEALQTSAEPTVHRPASFWKRA